MTTLEGMSSLSYPIFTFMIKGALTFFMFLFANPEQAISKRLDGYWYVTEDRTSQERELYRFYSFEKCEKFEDDRICAADYGWTKNPENYRNLRDEVAFNYRISKADGKFILETDFGSYDFILDLKQDQLFLSSLNSEDELVMKKMKDD